MRAEEDQRDVEASMEQASNTSAHAGQLHSPLGGDLRQLEKQQLESWGGSVSVLGDKSKLAGPGVEKIVVLVLRVRRGPWHQRNDDMACP